MSEWFYIKQWRLNEQKSWCIIDTQGNILLSDVNKQVANSKQEELEDLDIKTYIVNKNGKRYNDLVTKKLGDHNENSNTQI